MSTKRVDSYLERLKRRETFLAERVEGKDVDKSHYDRAELTALQWAIAFAEDNIEQAAQHQIKWFNEVKNG